jgi:formyl-CoA transferase
MTSQRACATGSAIVRAMSGRTPSNDDAPLTGVRVVDDAVRSGPSATQILAWLGADVIKVEPPGGEPSRYLLGGDATRDSIVFVLFNQSKRSVVLDLTTDADRRHLRTLLQTADVLAENFAPGTLERLGLPIDTLLAELPQLIVASVRGYAPGGPWSGYKSLDFVGQAVGGAMSVTGAPDGPPMRVGVTIADSGTGPHPPPGSSPHCSAARAPGAAAASGVALGRRREPDAQRGGAHLPQRRGRCAHRQRLSPRRRATSFPATPAERTTTSTSCSPPSSTGRDCCAPSGATT